MTSSPASSLRRLSERRLARVRPRERIIVNQHLQTRAATDADAVRLCTFLNACTLAHQGIARFSPDDALARLRQSGSDPRARLLPRVRRRRDRRFRQRLAGRRGRGQVLRPHASRRATAGRWNAPRRPLRSQGRRAASGRTPHDHHVGRRRRRAAAPTRPRLPGRPSLPPDGDRGRRRARRRAGVAGPDRVRPLLGPSAISNGRSTTPGWPPSQASGVAGDENEETFWRERRDEKAESAFPFDPTLWLLALDRGDVVGFCLCEIGASEVGAIGRRRGDRRAPVAPRQGPWHGAAAPRLLELRRRGAGGSSSMSMPRT